MDEKMLVPYDQNALSIQSADAAYDAIPVDSGSPAGGLVAVLLRRWYVAVIAAIVVIGAGVPVIWYGVKPPFTATGAIEIAPVIQRIVFSEEAGTMPFYSQFVHTQAALIKSDTILFRALEDPEVRPLKYVQNLPDKLAYLQSALDATPDRGSQMLKVSMSCEDAVAAQQIANAVIRAYMAVEGNSELTSEDETLRTLERERDNSARKLKELYDQQHQLGEEYGTTDLASREDIMLKRIQTLQDDLTRVQVERYTLQTQAKQLEDKQTTPPSPQDLVKLKSDTVNSDPAVTYYSQTITQMEKDFTIGSLRYNRDTGEMKFQRTAIDALKGKLDEARADASKRFDDLMTKQLAQQVKSDAEGIKARIAQLDTHEERVKADMKEQNDELIGLGRKDLIIKQLGESIKSEDDFFQQVKQRIQVLQVERQRPARIRVAWYAGPPTPEKDKRTKYIGVLLIGAFIFGCALTIFLHELDMRVESPSDIITKCRIRILGTTPRFKDLDKSRVQARHFVDDCRTIRVNLMLADGGEAPRAIVLASPQGRDGKTTVAINLATSIALTGRRVLLIDGDFRKPEVARYLRLNNARGLTNVLAGECSLDEAIQTTPVSTLHILPANRNGHRQNELLVSRRLSAILGELRQRYEEIIIDTPAVLAMPDAKLWACMSDGVVLIARSGKTGMKEFIEAKVRMQQAGARILGAVVTGVRISDSYEKYHHRYGEGYVEEPISKEDWDAAKVFLLSRQTTEEVKELPEKNS
jgi:polysaccharide biosynthesis transport protein